MTLQESVQHFIQDKQDYYKQWIFDKPLLITKKDNDELKKLQNIMYRLIQQFVLNYQQYKHLMPVASGVEDIIAIFNKRPYKIGTYRTDFVYDDKHQVKIIEITCRFALNGIFYPALMNNLSQNYQEKLDKKLEVQDIYTEVYKHLESYMNGATSICILKGDDVRNESKLYIDIFKRMGLEVVEIPYTEIPDNLAILNTSWVISELSFDEILTLSKPSLVALSSMNLINDFRTVFLIHDKRFFSVLNKKELQEKVLSPEEITFFKKFYIPSYNASEAPEIWASAQKNKDCWIMKHRALGKSQKIYAGLVTDENKWQSLFSEEEKKEMILQEWIPQVKIKGTIKENVYEDFITGTLLFFDDNYYGFGDFRTSSHPVTNKVDHRKMTHLILK